ncbi:class I SAM-dependent methyltransferase [Nitrospinota bacterium]
MDQKRSEKKDEEISFWDDVSPDYYEDRYGNQPTIMSFGMIRRKEIVAKLMDEFGPKGGKLIDLGCGPAVMFEPVYERGYQYTGVDYSPDMIEISKQRISNIAPDAKPHLFVGDVEDTKLSVQEFNVAVALGVTDYLDKEENFYREVHRLLKPDGVAIFTYSNRLSYDNFLRFLLRPLARLFNVKGKVLSSGLFNKGHIASREAKKLRRLGFEVLRSTFYGAHLIPINIQMPGAYFSLLRFLERIFLKFGLTPFLSAYILVAKKNPVLAPSHDAEMRWIVKSLGFRVFNLFPRGGEVLIYLQKRVTKRLPRKMEPVERTQEFFISHARNFTKNYPDFNDALHFEFGGGHDLNSSIVMYCFGISRQIIYDIQPLAHRELINHIIEFLMENPLPGAVRQPQHTLGDNFIGDLNKFYGIEYHAPAYARNVNLQDSSVDLLSTTNTLQHIPESVLKKIMDECFRLCHGKSVVSMNIDYSDHYSHTDNRISPYNFLKFSDGAWKIFNPKNHFQNRLRHSDYRKIFLDAGFRIVSEEKYIPSDGLNMLQKILVNKKFRTFSQEELSITRGQFVLMK